MRPTAVLSFDCGLRTLAVALVEPKHTPCFPPEVLKQASPEESAAQWRERVLAWFLTDGWRVREGMVIDVTAAVPGGVKDVRRMSPVTVAAALHASLTRLEVDLAGAPPYTTVAVEVQHNANAPMRAVCLGILSFYMATFPPARGLTYENVTGGKKLQLCEALGVPVGAGIAYLEGVAAAKAAAKAVAPAPKRKKASAAAAAPAPAPVPAPAPAADELEEAALATTKNYAWRRGGVPRFQGRGKDNSKYLDNKFRAVLALDKLKAGLPPDPKWADHNLADAVLQGLWVLFQLTCPAAPRKRTAARTAGPAAPKRPRKKE